MSQDDLFGAPAGWYPDPLGLPQLRWWNNHAWTEQTSAARQPMVVQDTKFAWADDDLPSRRQEREREREQQRDDRPPVAEAAPSADSLRELEPPRAFAKIEQENSAAPAASSTTAATDAPAENKWWSAPKAAEDRRSAAAARQAAAAQAAAIRAAAAQAAAAQAAEAQAAANAAAAPVADVPIADLFDSHYFASTPVAEAAPASAAAPAATAQPDQTVSIADIFDAHYFSTPTAAAAPAQTFDALFDTTAPLTATEPALVDLFGSEPLTRAGARGRRPIISADVADRSNPIVVRDKVNSNTGISWVIAMIPLAQLVVSLLLVTSLGGSADLSLAFVAVIVLPYFIAIALAYADYRSLLRAGSEQPASWAWAFLTAPIYLIVRARSTLRETGHGIGPILVWLALGMLQLVSLVAIPGVLIAAAPTVFAQQIEQSVEQQAATVASATVTVDCTAIPPVVAGQEITCSTLTNGTKSSVIVALQRSNGWISWQVVDWGKFAVTG